MAFYDVASDIWQTVERGAVAKRGAAGDDCVVCLAAGRPDAAAWRDDPAW